MGPVLSMLGTRAHREDFPHARRQHSGACVNVMRGLRTFRSRPPGAGITMAIRPERVRANVGLFVIRSQEQGARARASTGENGGFNYGYGKGCGKSGYGKGQGEYGKGKGKWERHTLNELI